MHGEQHLAHRSSGRSPRGFNLPRTPKQVVWLGAGQGTKQAGDLLITSSLASN